MTAPAFLPRLETMMEGAVVWTEECREEAERQLNAEAWKS